MKRVSVFVVLLSLVASAAQAWPTLPVGSQILLDCLFNTTDCNGQMANVYNGGSIVSDGSAPESPPNVNRMFRAANAVTGGAQLDFFVNPPASELYFGYVFRASPQFCGYPNNTNKMVMPQNNESTSIVGWVGGVNCNNPSIRTLLFNNQNSGVLNNCHYATAFSSGGQANGPYVFGDCPGGLNFYPNVGNGAYTSGTWAYLEWCGKSSTTLTSRDGIYKWALNGQVIGNFNQSNTGSPWSAVHITQAWDGTGTPWGVDAWWDADRFVVARLPSGGCASMNGGGTVTPSIDNPAGAPGLVSGFTATVGGVQ